MHEHKYNGMNLIKPGFYIVVIGLSRSLLNLNFIQNCERLCGNMNEIFAKTSNDPQRQPTTGSLEKTRRLSQRP